jgi:phenolic acid decarboxylase
MDWSKAKNILIIGFAITNILLFALWMQMRDRQLDPDVTPEYVEAVRDQLKFNHIRFTGDMDTERQEVAPVMVRFVELNGPTIAFTFFGKDYQVTTDPYFEKYETETETLTFNFAKEFFYTSRAVEEIYPDLNQDQAQEIALAFLGKMGIDPDKVKVAYVDEVEYREPYTGYRLKPSSYQVQLLSTDGDHMIGGSFFDMSITRSGVVFAHGLALEVVRASQESLSMPRMPDALLMLMGMQEDQYKRIVSAEVAYNFDPYKNDYFFGDVIEGEALPTWRFQFSDGTVRYLDL